MGYIKLQVMGFRRRGGGSVCIGYKLSAMGFSRVGLLVRVISYRVLRVGRLWERWRRS
jgi:hypothetical protein